MYPIRLQIAGIRDFSPQAMDLDKVVAHVLVGGKNGSGKSTLVYAIAFALGSPRISVDGLRSKTSRRGEDGWYARVSVLFHNPPGENRKDAPEYVELHAEVRVAPGTERRQLNYSLYGGEVPDKLSLLRKFQSRNDAREYYRRVFGIDAEGYFMFWYQGSIAEFANISDAARFQRVAEMFGLDELQREWELARIKMNDARDDFERARTLALNRRRRLQELEKFKNALEQRDFLRRDALLLYDACHRGLLELLRGEQGELLSRLDKYQKEHQQNLRARDDAHKALRDVTIKLSENSDKRNIKQSEFASENQHIIQLNEKIRVCSTEKEELSKKVRDLESKMYHIRRSKEDLLAEQGALRRELEILEERIRQLSGEIDDLTGRRDAINVEIGKAGSELERVKENIQQLEADQSALPSLEILREQYDKLKNTRDSDAGQKALLEERCRSLEADYVRLAGQKTLLLAEQEKLLKLYRQAGIKAYAFGEIFEVRGEISREEIEHLLAPLKHTLFVEQSLGRVPVEKAFYVVDLSRPHTGEPPRENILQEYLIPTEGVCPEEFLEKVNCWLAFIQLNPENNPPGHCGSGLVLWQGNLWDCYGLRGAVERGAAIGVKAIEIARRELEEKISQAGLDIENLDGHIKEMDEKIKDLSKKINRRQNADESLPGLSIQKQLLGTKLEQMGKELAAATETLAKTVEERNANNNNKVNKEQLLKQVEGELTVYAEYEREEKNIIRIRELSEALEKAEGELIACRQRSDALEGEVDSLERVVRELSREEDARQGEYDKLHSLVERQEQDLAGLNEQASTLSIEIEEVEVEQARLIKEFAEVITNLENTSQWLPFEFKPQEKNRYNFQRKKEEARGMLDDARSRVVNENALEEYNDFSYEYNLAVKELEECELRYNNLCSLEEERRQNFDKSVYNRWLGTNRRFSDYMRRLGMVGEVRSISPDPESRHASYQWELHVATRAGHRPERIVPESGRTVGEGISGGERAATSLVFALALLSDIERKPPFYVLDEFDSALDEERKHDIFDLYRSVLDRKMIIVSPKIHGDQYLNRFNKFLCVVANPGAGSNQTVSEVYDVTREEYVEIRGEDE
ncbi:MAG: hypothetical protein VR69_01425 [Peptococcaceae bacterium BRH_c4b]|nr:MAG: hypothetical protein VR69_01425 [Peptococcaceae bacterium BRH_c4b]